MTNVKAGITSIESLCVALGSARLKGYLPKMFSDEYNIVNSVNDDEVRCIVEDLMNDESIKFTVFYNSNENALTSKESNLDEQSVVTVDYKDTAAVATKINDWIQAVSSQNEQFVSTKDIQEDTLFTYVSYQQTKIQFASFVLKKLVDGKFRTDEDTEIDHQLWIAYGQGKIIEINDSKVFSLVLCVPPLDSMEKCSVSDAKSVMNKFAENDLQDILLKMPAYEINIAREVIPDIRKDGDSMSGVYYHMAQLSVLGLGETDDSVKVSELATQIDIVQPFVFRVISPSNTEKITGN